MATTLRKLIVLTISFIFFAMIAAREMRAATAVETQGGKFAGMVLIPAGEFTIGRDGGPKNETPAHKLFLPAFHIDRNLVTARDYAKFIQEKGPIGPKGEMYLDVPDPDVLVHNRDGKWLPKEGFENHPVGEMSRTGAAAYCAWAGKRLPSEAEWEKAARGTDGRRYPWGNTAPDATRARFGAAFNETAPVDRSPSGASPYGALDLAGNAWEWVSSAYRPYPYDARDGREDTTPGPVRGTRGGGHDSGPEEITVTQRGRNLSRNPRAGHHNIGFRCAL